MDIFRTIYERSLERPDQFWAEAAAALHWDKPFEKVLDDSHAPIYRWFKGGRLNTCYNAVDRHVAAGRGSRFRRRPAGSLRRAPLRTATALARDGVLRVSPFHRQHLH